MNDMPLSQEQVDSIFAQLKAEDVDQFYRGYQRWRFQQRLDALHEQIDALQQRIADNSEEMQQSAPSAMALASLARMQSRGVQDANLLDRLLERGEEWLDRTIQRLEYCEQTGLIDDDYTKWCEHALEGAYDWIDSLTGANGAASAQQTEAPNEAAQETASEPLPQTTEAMLLQKLMSDEEEVTLKIPTVPATPVLAEANAAEPTEVPAEQIVPEEHVVPDSSEPETLAEGEIRQQTDAAQQTSEEAVAPYEEIGMTLSESPPESEETVVSEEISKPSDAAQEIIPDEISEPDTATQAEEAQEPAPSEQYAFPASFDEIAPAETLSPQGNPPPSTESAAHIIADIPTSVQPAATPTIADVPTVVQPAATPVARQPRKRNFLQKLIYVLIGK